MPASAVPAATPPARVIRFTRQIGFQKTLNERVNAYLRENAIPARDVPAMRLKTAVMLAAWLTAYLLLLLGHFSLPVNLLLSVLWGLVIAGIGFNVMHDANHGAYSDNPRVNRLARLSGEFLGMSGFRWRTKHNVWHHTYTNIAGYDDDVETFGLMRLSPRLPWKPLFRAQTGYFWLVYSGIAFDFIFKDFMMVLAGKSDANHVYPKMNTEDLLTFWAGKLYFALIMVVLPLRVFPWWQVLIQFVVVMMTAGLAMGIVFQLAHINGDVDFPVPTVKAARESALAPEQIDNEWAVHQVQTTADFAPGNWMVNYYTGGLNFQVEHHLLPHICHLNYPRLAPIVRATCEEFGLPYHCYPTWRGAFAAHWNELRLLSQPSPT